jgi:spore maturation protein CgeB
VEDYSVIVTGASPDRTNRNTALRSYVVEGFKELLGAGQVGHCALEFAASLVTQYRPNALICFGSCMPDDADYAAIRKACDGCGTTLVFWLHDDPYEFDFNYKACAVADFIFSNDRWCAFHYDHPRAFHLPLAASKSAHWRPLRAEKNIDVFFCGVAFPNRVRLVNDLKATLLKHKTTILGDQWPVHELPFARNKRLPNSMLSDYYADSLVTLNMGRDFHYANDRFKLEPSTPGPRTFEAAMAGTSQFYFVESLEIADYYQPSSEIILFDSIREFSDLVEKILSQPLIASEIANAAQSRTLNDHQYRNRADALLTVVRASTA